MLLSAALYVLCVIGISAIRNPILADELHQQMQRKATSDPPWFCHDLDCPEFDVVETYKRNTIELREYKPSVWASTKLTKVGYDSAARTAGKLLDKYFAGGNANKTMIKLTAPVKIHAIPTPGKPACEQRFVVSYMIPFKHQAAPPVPSDSSVHITKVEGGRFYVTAFDKWIDEYSLMGHVIDLWDDLDQLGLNHDQSYFFSATYDPPEAYRNRHNEVWVGAVTPVEPPTSPEEPPASPQQPPSLPQQPWPMPYWPPYEPDGPLSPEPPMGPHEPDYSSQVPPYVPGEPSSPSDVPLTPLDMSPAPPAAPLTPIEVPPAPATPLGSCHDRLDDCRRLVSEGWCYSQREYMIGSDHHEGVCQDSCGLCDKGGGFRCPNEPLLCATIWLNNACYLTTSCPCYCKDDMTSSRRSRTKVIRAL